MNTKRRYAGTAVFLLAAVLLMPLHAKPYMPEDVVWTTQSRNSSESMPCGGHDIGMNIWSWLTLIG